MKAITENMIHIYCLKKLKFDFMGYTFKRPLELSYHHLIVPARCGGKETVQNGAILKRTTSHDYLHRIEQVDPDIFYYITSEMEDENIKGKLDLYNLRKIRDLLEQFEKEHCSDRLKKGKMLIKEEYISERIAI